MQKAVTRMVSLMIAGALLTPVYPVSSRAATNDQIEALRNNRPRQPREARERRRQARENNRRDNARPTPPPRRDRAQNPPPRRDRVGNPPPSRGRVSNPPPRRDRVGNPPPRRDRVGNPPPRRDRVGNPPPRRGRIGNPPPRRAPDRVVRPRPPHREIRRQWRRHFDRIRRPIPDHRRRVIRDHRRWERRHARWRSRVIRPVYPEIRWRIVVPIPWPERGTWATPHIYDVAANLEYLSQQIYFEAERESRGGPWDNEALSALYDVVTAAYAYNDALQSYPRLQDTIYELFNLEEAMVGAGHYAYSGHFGPMVEDNFRLLEYYVNELLWHYRYL